MVALFSWLWKTEPKPNLGLPQELVDLIIDQLPSDRKTLRACALTNKSFVHRAQANLFREVAISGHPIMPPQSCARHIQHLRLINIPFHDTPESDLSQLTQLRSLSIINVDVQLLYHMQWPSTVESLFLSLPPLPNRDAFFGFVSNFPRLRVLRLSQLSCVDGSSQDGVYGHGRMKIPLKILETSLDSNILKDSFSPFDLDGLEELVVRPKANDLDVLGKIQDLLEDACKTVTVLEVDAFTMWGRSDLLRLHLYNLRVLKVSVTDLDVHRHLFGWWVSLLSNDDEQWEIEELEITVSVFSSVISSDSFGGREWDALVSVLNGRHLASLRRVTVHVERKCPEALEDFRSVVDDALKYIPSSIMSVVDVSRY